MAIPATFDLKKSWKIVANANFQKAISPLSPAPEKYKQNMR